MTSGSTLGRGGKQRAVLGNPRDGVAEGIFQTRRLCRGVLPDQMLPDLAVTQSGLYNLSISKSDDLLSMAAEPPLYCGQDHPAGEAQLQGITCRPFLGGRVHAFVSRTFAVAGDFGPKRA
jgi:hypothetical protein